MKVKALNKGYYNQRIIKAGEVFEFEGNKLPSWVQKTKQDKKQENKNSDKNENPKGNGENKSDGNKDEQINTNNEQNSASDEQNIQKDEQNNASDKQKGEDILDEIEKEQYLDLLLDEATEKNIVIDDADKKTVEEKIAELEAKLGKEK